MKNLKNYILITFSLLVAAVVGAILVWYFLVLAPINNSQITDSNDQKTIETELKF